MKILRVIVVAQSVLLVASVISLCLAITEADRGSVRAQALYKIGLRDGEIFARGQLTRAQAEADLLADQRAKQRREKL